MPSSLSASAGLLVAWLAPFAVLFTGPTRGRVPVLVEGTLLSLHRRTVSAALRATGRDRWRRARSLCARSMDGRPSARGSQTPCPLTSPPDLSNHHPAGDDPIRPFPHNSRRNPCRAAGVVNERAIPNSPTVSGGLPDRFM